MAAMVVTFAAVVPFHLLLTLLGRRDVVPPPFLGAIGWLAGLRIKVEGRPAPGRLLLLGNHTSWLDILALAGVSKSAFVAKGELTGHRFLKWLCDQNDTVFVARRQGRHVASQVDEVRATLALRHMAIFPEGTTSDGIRLLPFKSSLLSAVERLPGVIVQPVALVYEDAAGIAWFGDEPGMANVRRILARRRPVRLTIRFLAPLEGVALADRKAMAAAAHAAIGEALRL